MRKLMSIMLMLAVAAVLLPYCTATTADSDQQATVAMSTMTVAELETKGDILRVRKDYAGAIQHYRAALKKDRNNAQLYNKIGIAELQRGEYSAAASDFEKAIKRNRNYAEAYNNVGSVAYVQKNYGKAIRYFKKALALTETNASFHNNLGAAWFAQNQIDRAIVEYSRALELDPEILLRSEQGGVSAQIRPEERARYMYLLAKLYAKRGDADRVLECLKKAQEEGYPKLGDVYKDQEFATMWQDARLNQLVPPPTPK